MLSGVFKIRYWTINSRWREKQTQKKLSDQMIDTDAKCYFFLIFAESPTKRMEEADLLNQTTSVTYIWLRGLSVNQKVQMTVFALFLTSYVLTLIGNILIVITIIYDHQLHTTMYFFLCNLSFIDVCHSTVTVPKMLRD